MAKREEIRMKLDCTFTLTKEAEEAKLDIANFVEKANESILIKGAPRSRIEKASKILNWSLEGKNLHLKIESGTHVRATSAVLRIRKSLAKELGEKYQIGIRDIKLGNFFVNIPLSQQIPEEVIKKVHSIPTIASVKLVGNELEVEFKPMGYSDLSKGIPERTIKLIEELIEESIKAPVPIVSQVVRRGREKPIKFREDPAKVALELGWIKEFPGKGQWIYTPPFAALVEVIESILMEEVVHKLEFKPCLLPKLIPFEVMKKMPGYFETMPEGMYYVCSPPRDPSTFERFKNMFKITKEIPLEELRAILKDPAYVLAPAQCEPFWYAFGSEMLRLEELPIKLYDRSGWTYRWEGGGAEGIIRLHEFRRIELAYCGKPDDVVKIRDSILERCIRVADEILDLEWRVVTDVPFWAKSWGSISDFNNSKQVPGYDLEVYLPYKGPREEAKWLEIAGCFVHRKEFIDSFKVKEIKKREIWTGCAGLGISRWVAAFLSRHGFNVEEWPEPVRSQYRMLS